MINVLMNTRESIGYFLQTSRASSPILERNIAVAYQVPTGTLKGLGVTWLKERQSDREIQYRPARVLMQDFTGVPAVVDLAASRRPPSKAAMAKAKATEKPT